MQIQPSAAPVVAAEPTPEQAQLDALFGQSLAGVFLFDAGVLVRVNERFAEIFATSRKDLEGRHFRDLAAAESAGALAAFEETGGQASVRIGFSGLTANGDVIDLEVAASRASLGSVWAGIVLDVTDRRRTRDRLVSLAFHDSVTGLANRALMLDRLRLVLSSARRYDTRFAVLMLDLDDFKSVNDRYGHAAGDELLRMAGSRILSCLRDSDTAARLGGDEFVVLLPNVRETNDVGFVAERIIAAIGEPFGLPDGTCRLGASIGISLFPRDGDDIETLLARADAAMYGAKRGGKSRFLFSRPEALDGVRGGSTFIELSAEHRVGVGELDRDHLRLADLINGLAGAFDAGRPLEHVLELMAELIMSTKLHFATEERYMDLFGGRDADIHRQEHRRLLADVESLVDGIDAESVTATLHFLKAWLLSHIARLDRPLGAQLLAQGVDPLGSIEDHPAA